jgi:hypothetical protein
MCASTSNVGLSGEVVAVADADARHFVQMRADRFVQFVQSVRLQLATLHRHFHGLEVEDGSATSGASITSIRSSISTSSSGIV